MITAERANRGLNSIGVAVGLLVAFWIALINIAVSGLVISNTLQGLEPVSALFVLCFGCIVVYGAVVVVVVRQVAGGRSLRELSRWLVSRLLIVGCIFIGISLLAAAVP